MLTVLVFGSHPDVVVYVVRSLRDAGYHVLSSLTRADTLRHLERASVDAMILGGPTAHQARDEVVAALRARAPWAPVFFPRHPDEALELVEQAFSRDVT